jgi:hypothetical protein
MTPPISASSLHSLVSNLTVRQGESLLSQICLDFTAYTRPPFFEEKTKSGILDFYKKAAERFGARWRWYESDLMEAPKRVSEQALQLLPQWLAAKSRREQYTLLLRDGGKDDDVGTTAFEIGAFGKTHQPGFVRLSLPASFLCDPGPAAYAELCDALVENFPFVSAHAGFSLRWDEYGKRHFRQGLKHAEFIAEWYPGIDLPDDSLTILEADLTKSIRPVGWLTYLGSALVGLRGGAEGLRASLPAPVQIRPLPHGVVLQAGAHPVTGNSPYPEDLESYQAVGRVLAPLVMTSHPPIVRKMQPWLARFNPALVAP